MELQGKFGCLSSRAELNNQKLIAMIFKYFKGLGLLEKKEAILHEEHKFHKGNNVEETTQILAEEQALMGVL